MLFKKSRSQEPLENEQAETGDRVSLDKFDRESNLKADVAVNRTNSPKELKVTDDDETIDKESDKNAFMPGEVDTMTEEPLTIEIDDENTEKLAEIVFEKPKAGEKEEDLVDEQDMNLFVAGENDSNDSDEEHEKSDDGNSLSSLFADEEEDKNPLAGLINALPDVQATELLQQAQTIRAMLQQVRQGER